MLRVHTDDKGYVVIMDKHEIVMHYLEGWFLIDLIATVQWEFIFTLFFDPQHLPSWVSMLALLKILRLARASRLIDAMSSKWSTHSGFVEAGKFFMYVAIVAHLLGCFFFLWPIMIGEDNQL